MVKLEDDYILRADVEYTIIGVIATLILPCVLFNIFIIIKILKQNEYKVFNIMPKTVNLYYNIAIADVLMGIFAMPWVIYYISIGRPAEIQPPPNATVELTEMINKISDSYAGYRNNTFHCLMCTVSGYAYNVLVRVTSLTVLLLGIDRTHAIYFPLTYSRTIYTTVYKCCIYIIWAFALGIQALPFLAGIPYVEQFTRELMCSWSILQLLGLSPAEIMDNMLQMFFPYFVLVDIPLLIPTTLSVLLSFAVLFKILFKRYQYIAEKQNQIALASSPVQTEKRSPWTKFRAAVTFSGGDNHKVKSLTRASVTMLIIVLTHSVFYSYTWYICVANTLFMLGVPLPYLEKMGTDQSWMYINSSFHISVFFQSAVTPFVVYFRVIKNFTASAQNNKSTTTFKNKTDLSAKSNQVNNHKMKSTKNGRSCDYALDKSHNGRAQKFV